jgi:hypothetical protein
LAEAEDHLRAATATSARTGLAIGDAEAEAVRQFGDPARFAAGIRRAHLDVWSVARRAFTGTWLVGAVSLIAIGIAGGVSELLGRLFGAGFVAGDRSGVTYTPDRCADYFEYFPHAASCGDAAALHHWGEVVEYRVAVGVLGLIALGLLVLARRTVLQGGQWALPRPYVAAVLLAILGAAGVLLTGVSLMSIVFGETSGVGVNLADGVTACLVAVAVLVWSVRAMRAVR